MRLLIEHWIYIVLLKIIGNSTWRMLRFSGNFTGSNTAPIFIFLNNIPNLNNNSTTTEGDVEYSSI